MDPRDLSLQLSGGFAGKISNSDAGGAWTTAVWNATVPHQPADVLSRIARSLCSF